jgi:hypothetical protein
LNISILSNLGIAGSRAKDNNIFSRNQTTCYKNKVIRPFNKKNKKGQDMPT